MRGFLPDHLPCGVAGDPGKRAIDTDDVGLRIGDQGGILRLESGGSHSHGFLAEFALGDVVTEHEEFPAFGHESSRYFNVDHLPVFAPMASIEAVIPALDDLGYARA